MNMIIPYAALLALLFLVLTFRTIFLRGGLRVSLGDGGSPALQRAIRAHANFSEYVPLALLLLVLLGNSGARPVLVHLLCAALCLGRLLHALGVSRIQEPMILRVSGMVLTTSCLAISAIYLFVIWLSGVGI